MATQHLHGLRMNKIANTNDKRRRRTRWGFFFAVVGSILFSIMLVAGSIFLPALHMLPEILPLPLYAGSSTSTIQALATDTNTGKHAALPSGAVCTNVPEGRLHVRLAPGEDSAEAGYLTEGEVVTINITPPQTAPDGGKWIELVSPLSGWVNANYICTPKTNASASTANTNASASETQK